MAKRSQQFQTIRTEGAILPPDILRLVASLKVDGATPDAYHLSPGSKLNEAISQSWTSLLNHWQVFQEARDNLSESEQTATAVTNERWLLPLFKELDFGRLVTSKSPEIDGRSYPIERFYNHTPIHLIGCKLPLDRRTSGARGAATASPHSMVQEYLNRSDEHLWAFLSNGLQLRVLRDNISLSRQAFVEFDLEAMMEGEVYADFALLWLLCHQSRVESDKAVDCWLEKWSKLAQEQGTRVLNDLRVGVQNSIEALGRGFIGHPRNDHLREKLSSGTLSTDEFYRQLLRTVYRLLFLFVAEDRELLHSPDSSAEACNLYDTHYSTRRLRELAHKIRGSKHADLWHSLSLVFDALSKNEGCPQLGLSGLGSFLWRANSTSDLLGPFQANGEAVLITNDDLLQAIRALAYVEQDTVLRIVDYRNLGSEELGSVYESLLELHPVMNADAKAFDLSTAAGNERKTTGSYYTPDSLVQCLLDSALDPVVEDRLKGKKGDEAAQAVLDMKVCDPACGSGHFLIAAAHRLARHLARVRTGETEPSPVDYQHALRDVIGRCVYGVDLNPMAVELCKVSLWMEAIEPGKPLSFLDHHIQCGNSLLGTTPALLAKGIPDDAFKPIEGDVKERVNGFKKDNKRERQDYESGQGYLFSPTLKLGNLPATISQINVASEESVEDVTAKQAMYAKLVKGADYLNARLLADTWCATFVWKKDDSDLGKLCPTERDFRSIEDNPHIINIHIKAEVQRLSRQYHFFHWHLAFPDVFVVPDEMGNAENTQVGWSGGFDVVLGNPPWERVVLKEKEFFAERSPEIAVANTAAQRRKLIAELEETEPSLFHEFREAQRQGEGESHLLRWAGCFPLCGVGRDINSAFVFSELAYRLIRAIGRMGLIVPSAVVTDNTTKLFFQDMMATTRLISAFDFENRSKLFADIDSRMKFCLLTVSGRGNVSQRPRFAFFLTNTSDLEDEERQFSLSANDIARISPNTRTCPVFRNRRDAEIARAAFARTSIIANESNVSENDWGVKTRPGLYHMTNDSALFKTARELVDAGLKANGNKYTDSAEEYLPLYEAKMIHQFDHRWSSFDPSSDNAEAANAPCRHPDTTAIPKFWTDANETRRRAEDDHYSQLVVRVITNPTNERTVISTVLPKYGIGNSLLLVVVDDEKGPLLTASLNTFSADYFARQKLAGTNLNPYIFKQLPVPSTCTLKEAASLDKGRPWWSWVLSRSFELLYTAWDLEAFAANCGYAGPPFRWDEQRRFLLRCELDAAYFHLYLGSPSEWGTDNTQLREMFPTPRDAVDYIMETFPIVKRKDIKRTEIKNDKGEVTHEGRYITKDTILDIYDEMAEAIRTGQPYQTRLYPPPGPPTDSEGNFIPMAEWAPNDWPSHIHPPREESEVTDG